MLVFLIFSSCSKDDDVSGNKGFLNPPSWIIGTWVKKTNSSIVTITGYRFTKDNMITLIKTKNGLEQLQDFKKGFKNSVDIGVSEIKETIKDNYYKFEISSGGVTNSWYFTKTSDNIILDDFEYQYEKQ